MSKNTGDGTGALEKALDVLEAVGAAPEGLSQNELTERLALPRTTTYRLLATLVARGLLRRDPLRKVYCLGFRCFEMARQAHAMPDLVAAASLELRTLRDLTGETAYLAALDGREVISLERCDGAHSQRSQAVLGQRKPIHCTSQGKAILSALDEASREALLRDLPLKPLTPRTLTDRRRLQAEIKLSAARGYAVDDEEIVLGVRCVGAPIVDSAGRVRGAISVAGPAYRLTPERLQLLGPELAEAARRVGAQLQAAQPAGTDEAVEVLPGPWAFFGAHPDWDPDTQSLVWADVLAPSVRCHQVGQDRVLIQMEHPVTALVRRSDGLYAATQQALLRCREGLSEPTEQRLPAGLLALCCDAEGGWWAAAEQPGGGTAIGRLQADGGIAAPWRLPEPVQCLRWRAQDGALVATVPDRGDILMMQPGNPGMRRLATVPKGSGRISGLAFDHDGGLWTALRGGWGVLRLGPDGSLDRMIGLPVPCPTDVVMDEARQQLYVVTARQPVALDTLANAPLSGRVFRMRV